MVGARRGGSAPVAAVAVARSYGAWELLRGLMSESKVALRAQALQLVLPYPDSLLFALPLKMVVARPTAFRRPSW